MSVTVTITSNKLPPMPAHLNAACQGHHQEGAVRCGRDCRSHDAG
jgi:hypothetical protein